MLDPIDPDGITVGIEYVSALLVKQEYPFCSICGDSITEQDVSCVRIDIPASNKMERMHDTEDCFKRFAVSLAYFFKHKPTGIPLGATLYQ